MRARSWGILAAVLAAFATGTKAGIEYAKSRYVSKDRKFIEGQVINRDEK